jgi:pimeloyl-ACP methyl ester carboxylesterase
VTLGLTLVPLPTRRVRVAGGELAYHDVPPSPSGLPLSGPAPSGLPLSGASSTEPSPSHAPAPAGSAPGAPPAGARGTAVFVPGYTGSKEDFALLAAPITAAGYRYVAVDQRGQHESPGPDDPAAYEVPALAAHLLSFLASLGAGPAHVVGHSFGGLVARAAAIADPAAFASLTLLGSGPAGLSGPRVERMLALEPLLDTHGAEAVFDAIVAFGPLVPEGELLAFLRRRFLASSPAGLRAMGHAVTDEPDRVDALRVTGVRVAVVAGEHDDAWPTELQRTMAERLGAPFTVVRGAVHSPAAEAPAETARVLAAFWSGA